MFDPKPQSQGAPNPQIPPPPKPPMPQPSRPPAPLMPKPAEHAPAKFEVPAGAAPKPPEPTIYVMPREYYGVAPKIQVKKSAPPPIAPPKPSPLPPKPQVPKPPKPKRKVPIVLIIGLFFLAVISISGFLMLRSLRPAVEPVTNVAPPPPVSVCGNGQCETSETSANCPNDCVPPAPPPPSPPEPIRGGIDTDSDGLSDYEEGIIYGTNPRNADTDGDTFIDGNEVFNLYDPLLPAPNTLSASTSFRSESINGFTFLAPQAWIRETSSLGESIIFRTPQGETIELSIIDREAGADLSIWFGTQFVGVTGEPTRTKSGFNGLRNLDERKFAIETSAKFISISYNLGDLRRVELLRTVEMMVNSITQTQ